MKYIFRFLPLLLAGLLAGCGLAQPPAAPSAPAPSLRALAAGDEAGCYLPCLYSEEGPRLLGYVDYSALTAAPLCQRPGCGHNTPACTAFFPADEVFLGAWVLDQRSLLLCTASPQEESARFAFYLADRQGGQRRQLFCGEPLFVPETDTLLADADNLYFAAAFGEEGRFFCRLRLADGQLERLFRLSHLQTLQGVLDGRVLSLVYDWTGMESLVPSAAARGTAEVQSQKPPELSGNRWLQLAAPENGSRSCLTGWQENTAADIRYLAAEGSTVWWITGSGTAGFWNTGGESGRLEPAWPFAPEEQADGLSVALHPEDGLSLVQGHLILTASQKSAAEGSLLYSRYSVDLSTGCVEEIPLYYVFGGVRMPIDLVAKAGEQLLVRISSSMEDTTAIGMYGQPYPASQQTDRFGLLSQEDFLAGAPRYREIHTSCRWCID